MLCNLNEVVYDLMTRKNSIDEIVGNFLRTSFKMNHFFKKGFKMSNIAII